jgi:hypothetical protein
MGDLPLIIQRQWEGKTFAEKEAHKLHLRSLAGLYNQRVMSIQSEIELIKDPSRFSRLAILLFEAEYGSDYQAIDDDRGDGGNDGYIFSEKRLFARHCFKKLPKKDLDEEILKKIRGDFAKAVKLKESGVYGVENWTFLSSYAVSNGVVVEAQKLGKADGINVSLKGPAYIATLAAKHKHLLSEFPELQQAQILEEMHQRFDDIEDKLPKEVSPEAQLLGEVQDYLIQLLSNLALYKQYEVNPYLDAVNNILLEAHKYLENKLPVVERTFKRESDYFKDIDSLSAELKKAGQAELSMDGGKSHEARTALVDSAFAQLGKLVKRIGKNVTLEGLDENRLGLTQSAMRWLNGIDESFTEFFDQAYDFAERFSRFYAYYFQAGEVVTADKYLVVAKNIIELSENRQSGYHDVLSDGIKGLKQQIGILDLSEEEATIIIEAAKVDGSIHKLKTWQIPQGFISAGSKTFASDQDIPFTIKYVEALDQLIAKGLVQHVRGALYSLTSAGWDRVK